MEAHEAYLRNECIQLVFRAIDEATSIALRRCCVSNDDDSTRMSSEQCRQFFDLFTPPPSCDDETNAVSEDSTHEVTVSKGNAEQAAAAAFKRHLFSFRPTKYPPTLLPMVIVKCYPSLLDRSEIVRGLVQDLSSAFRIDQDKERRRSCVCVIKSNGELIEQGHDLIAELLFQVRYISYIVFFLCVQ